MSYESNIELDVIFVHGKFISTFGDGCATFV